MSKYAACQTCPCQSCDWEEREDVDKHMSTMWNYTLVPFLCTVVFSLISTESAKLYENSRLKHTQVFTMTFITTEADSEMRHSSSHLGPKGKKKTGSQKITLFKHNKAVHPHLRAECCLLRLQLDKKKKKNHISLFFSLNVVIWRRQLSDKVLKNKNKGQNSSDKGQSCQSSLYISHNGQHICNEICTAKIDIKIDLIYFAWTALIVLAAKKG